MYASFKTTRPYQSGRPKLKHSIQLILVVCLMLTTATQARSQTFNFTFDSTYTNLIIAATNTGGTAYSVTAVSGEVFGFTIDGLLAPGTLPGGTAWTNTFQWTGGSAAATDLSIGYLCTTCVPPPNSSIVFNPTAPGSSVGTTFFNFGLPNDFTTNPPNATITSTTAAVPIPMAGAGLLSYLVLIMLGAWWRGMAVWRAIVKRLSSFCKGPAKVVGCAEAKGASA